MTSRAVLLALLPLTLACRTPSSPERATPPARIVLVTIDTWRADAIGASGSGRVTTPNLDALAAKGLYAPKAWTSATLTAPSHASILTGEQPYRHGLRNNHGYKLAAGATTLASILRGAGYATAAFVSAHPVSRAGGFDAGFDTFDDTLAPGDALSVVPRSRPGAATIDAARAWIAHAPARFFLWVHLYEPHDPYEPPEPYATRYRDRPYYGEVAYADELVGRLRDAIGDPGGERTAWIVCGDHGESLGEHGEQTHSLFVYDATARVPLIVWSPGRVPASRREGARLVDVLPTVLALARVPIPAGLDGRSIIDSAGDAPPAYVETMYPHLDFGAAPIRAISDGRLKVIDVPQREAYDLTADPGETRNLASDPSRVAAITTLLDSLSSTAGAATPSAPARDPSSEAALRSLGYIGAGGGYRLGEAGMDPKAFAPVYRALDEARALAHARRFEEAAARYPSLISSFPRSSVLEQEFGVLFLAGGRPQDAEPHLLRAVALDPANTHAWLGLANVALARSDFAAAEKRLLRVVALDADDVEANFDLGLLYFQTLKRPADARPYWERFLKLQPSDPEAPKIRAMLESAPR